MITHNTAKNGAGIYFDCLNLCQLGATKNYIVLNKESSLYIQHNHAEQYGGGIIVKTRCAGGEMQALCFFQIAKEAQGQGSHVYMSGNVAGKGISNSIYGGDLENCFLKTINNTIHYRFRAWH